MVYSVCSAEADNPSQSGKAMDESFDKEVEDVNRDTKAYDACPKCLEGERREVLGETDFLNEKLKVHISNTV
ncbi:cyclic nucleotide-gated ion channel 1-like [Pyrus ussuriensis x Pyrus communis]|uniref:Cyclic nucleotide-gated ion channel 1-like n=1 Tax=Pyrus ussuriensis x Pyrus communis TaxID=2448454 RepID=A0A5N5FGF2_9ROSA|nr:cyclic nucleotide-gated ion channel 1-like [Pyrus ussuriensis x Pyrus communis]